MAKKQKTAITVNEKEYFLEDMTEKQKTIVNHCESVRRGVVVLVLITTTGPCIQKVFEITMEASPGR